MARMTTPAPNAAETDVQSLMTTAKELLASRMAVIPPLAEAIAERKRLQELVDANEKTYGEVYSDAQAEGWTPAELRQMGAEEPTRRPQGRPRTAGGRRSRSKATPATTPNPRAADASETHSATAEAV